MTKVVVYWVESNKVSIEELGKINDEDRYVGAPTSIKCGTKYHKAIVRLISSDQLKLDAEEEKVAAEIDEKIQNEKTVTESDKRGRATRQKKAPIAGTATSNQVAASVGERLRPTPDQAEAAKRAAYAKKLAAEAAQQSRNQMDREVYGGPSVRRHLFDQEDKNAGDASEEECNVSDDDDGEEYVVNSGGEESDHGTSSEQQGCSRCQELVKAGKQSVPHFVSVLNEFINNDGHQKFVCLDLLPIPDGVPKCELSRQTKVFISNSDKNSIKRDGEGDPGKMVRLGIMALYGSDVFEREDITAIGNKRGSKGIPKNVREALRGFVNRNVGKNSPTLSKAQFNSIINRKKHQVQRKTPPPSTGKRPARGTQSQMKKKSPLKVMPQQQSLPKTGAKRHQMHNQSSAPAIATGVQGHLDVQPASHFHAYQQSSNALTSPPPAYIPQTGKSPRKHNSSAAAASGFQDQSRTSPPGYHSWTTRSPRGQNSSAAAASGFQAPATQPFSGNHGLNSDYSKSDYAQSTHGSRSPWKVSQFSSSPFFSPMCNNESSFYGNPHHGDQQNFTNTSYTVL